MPGVTKEQIARAKEWDLLSFLQANENIALYWQKKMSATRNTRRPGKR